MALLGSTPAQEHPANPAPGYLDRPLIASGSDKLGIGLVGFAESGPRIAEMFSGLGPVFAWLNR